MESCKMNQVIKIILNLWYIIYLNLIIDSLSLVILKQNICVATYLTIKHILVLYLLYIENSE